jgi:hypothetical protein
LPIIVIVFVIAIASLIWIDNNAICNHLDLFRKSSGAASKTAETMTKSEFESRSKSNEQEGFCTLRGLDIITFCPSRLLSLTPSRFLRSRKTAHPDAARISAKESAADSSIFKSIRKDATEFSEEARKAAKEKKEPKRTDTEGSQRESQTEKNADLHPRKSAHPGVQFSALETGGRGHFVIDIRRASREDDV